MTDIPRDVILTAETEDAGTLPRSVAELPQEDEAPEMTPYRISFARYNGNLCEIDLLDSNKAKKALNLFKTVGTQVCSPADFKKYSIDRIPVVRKGEYLKLYNRLGEDIEIKETKLQQNARIFYFDIEPERMLYVVAIKQNHFETDKVRRN